MKGRATVAVPLVLAFVANFIPCSAADALEAGAAMLEITPPLGTPLNGFERRLGRGATDIHDPLFVRALFLDDEATALFIVVADMLEITSALRERVLELSPLDLPPQHIILVATGTHNGPGGMDRALKGRLQSGRFVPDLVEQTARRFAETMRTAYDERRRGTIAYATTPQSVLARNAIQDDGPVVERIGVVRIDDADGNPIAILGNFAAPANSLGDEFLFTFSADFPGVFCRRLEELSTAGCVAFFLPGAGGDQEIVDPENHTGWDRAESVGNLLAVRVKGLANNLEGRELSTGIRAETAPLPHSIDLSAAAKEGSILALTIDRLAITFLGGMPYAGIANEINTIAKASAFRESFVVALSGEPFGYHATLANYANANGPRWNNEFGPGYEDWAATTATALFNAGADDALDSPATLESQAESLILRTEGGARARGRALGGRNAAALAKAFQERVVSQLGDGELVPIPFPWRTAPEFVDRTPLLAPRAAAIARERLGPVGNSVIEELLGRAEGAELPFDAVWMLHTVSLEPEQPRLLTAIGLPGKGLLGMLWAYTENSSPRVVHAVDSDGRSEVEVVYAAEARTLAGMNGAFAGLAILGDAADNAPLTPATVALKHILWTAGSPREAGEMAGDDNFAFSADILIAAGSTDDWTVLRGDTLRDVTRPVTDEIYVVGRNDTRLTKTQPVDQSSLIEVLTEVARQSALNNPGNQIEGYLLALMAPAAGEATFTYMDAQADVRLEEAVKFNRTGR